MGKLMEYIGRKLNGRYQLKKLLGSGGMANVFEAEDLADGGKTVAVKLLKQEYLTNEEFVRRFRNESKVISVLDHINIVQVYDVNFTGADQYIVMEYIDGITLNQYIHHQQKLRWKDAVHFTTQILRALQHAHEHGVVHRDIKSQNIMLLRDGTIKVMDFGIARFAREDIRSMDDKALGSVHYISPEQACGEESDAKSDIYSVGVLLYEMLVGAVPFDGATPEEVAMKHMHGGAVPIATKNPEVPTGLCEIAEKAMQREKNLRYRNAGEMLTAIEAFKKNPSIIFEYKYMQQETVPEEYGRSVQQIRGENLPNEDYDEEIIIKRSPTVLILTGIAAACCITALIVVLGFFYWGRDEKVPETKMPSLLGLVYEDIKNQEEYKRFNFIIEDRQLSDEYPAGQISSQNVKPGVTVKVDRTVKIVISDGIRTLKVPDLTGRDVAEAEQTLYDMGLDYTVRTQNEPNIPADQVIKTDPPADTQVEKTTQIVLYVSRGQADVSSKVPNVVGRDVEDGKARMETVGLTVVVKEVDSEKPPKIIVEQSLTANEYVKEGDSVTLKVSNGSGYLKKVPLQIDFPQGAVSKDYKLVVFVNGEDIGNVTVNPANLPSVSVEVKGNGIQPVVISLDGVKYAEFTVNFDTGDTNLTGGYYNDAIQVESASSGGTAPGDPGGSSEPTYPDDDPSTPSGGDGSSESDRPGGEARPNGSGNKPVHPGDDFEGESATNPGPGGE